MASFTSAWTLAEVDEMLAAWKACEKALSSGQAKRYRVGTREFESVDLPDIAARIRYFANLRDALAGNVRTSRVVRVVPRDL